MRSSIAGQEQKPHGKFDLADRTLTAHAVGRHFNLKRPMYIGRLAGGSVLFVSAFDPFMKNAIDVVTA